jgi:hypothetical protein
MFLLFLGCFIISYGPSGCKCGAGHENTRRGIPLRALESSASGAAAAGHAPAAAEASPAPEAAAPETTPAEGAAGAPAEGAAPAGAAAPEGTAAPDEEGAAAQPGPPGPLGGRGEGRTVAVGPARKGAGKHKGEEHPGQQVAPPVAAVGYCPGSWR